MIKASKVLWSVTLLLASLPVGFAVGGWIGGQWLVSDNHGLSGAWTIILSSFLGLIIGFVSSVLIVLRYKLELIRAFALIMLALALVGMIWLGKLSKQQHEYVHQNRYALITTPEIMLNVQHWERESIAHLEYWSESNQLIIEYADGPRCTGVVTSFAAQKVHRDIFNALRAVEMSGLLMYPPPCHTEGEVQAEVVLTIFESDAPIFQGQFPMTNACLVENSELSQLMHASRRLVDRFSFNMICESKN